MKIEFKEDHYMTAAHAESGTCMVLQVSHVAVVNSPDLKSVTVIVTQDDGEETCLVTYDADSAGFLKAGSAAGDISHGLNLGEGSLALHGYKKAF